jgi:predicted DNA-binding transcriptional regulator AlpA
MTERLGIREVERLSGLDRSSIWRKYTAEPPQFPRPHYIGNRRMWFAAELEKWAAEQMARPTWARRCNLGMHAQAKVTP